MTTRIELPLTALNRTDLPAVCAISGEEEGVTFRKVRFTWYPRWIALLALPALIVAVVLAAIMTRRAEGELPFTPRAYWRWKLGQAGFSLCVLVACVALPFVVYGLAADQGQLAAVSAVLALPLPLGAYFLLVWRRSVSVAEIRAEAVVLEIPSEAAARAWREKLSRGHTGLMREVASALGQEAAATVPAPADARCATHPQVAAAWACGRCGSFFCEGCAARPDPGARPLCQRCLSVRAGALGQRRVELATLGRLQLAGLLLGISSLIPGCWPGVLLGFAVNGVALHRTLKLPDRFRLALPVVGLACSLAGVALMALLLYRAR